MKASAGALDVILVGAGRIAVGNDALAGTTPLSHLAAIRAVGAETAHIRAVVEPDISRRDALTLPDGVLAATLAEVPRGHREVIAICTPSAIRRAPVCAALDRRPAALLVEKPLATTSAEAKDLANLCTEAGIPLVVNYNRRTDPRIQALRERARADPKSAHIAYGRGVLNYASHALDLLMHWWGAPKHVSWLAGEMAEGDTDANPSFAVRFANGAVAAFAGHDGLGYDLLDIQVVTASERIGLLAGGAEIVVETPEDDRYYFGYRHLAEATRDRAPVAGFAEVYRTIKARLDDDRDADWGPLCTGAEAVTLACALDAIRQSAVSGGRAVELC